MTKVDSNGQQPLVNALVASIASTSGVLEQAVSIISITASRRVGAESLSLLSPLTAESLVGISVSFKIFISTASLVSSAVTALSSAASSGYHTSGSLAKTFKTEAGQRGEVIAVAASLTVSIINSDSVIATLSDAEYAWWAVLLLSIGVGIVLLWCFIARDMLGVRLALANNSQHEDEEVTEQHNAMLLNQPGGKTDTTENTEELSIAASGQALQQIFLQCG